MLSPVQSSLTLHRRVLKLPVPNDASHVIVHIELPPVTMPVPASGPPCWNLMVAQQYGLPVLQSSGPSHASTPPPVQVPLAAMHICVADMPLGCTQQL